MMRTAQNKLPRGFTIIELLASVAIIGILASVAMPVIQTTVTRQKEAQLSAALMSMRSAIDAYKQAAVNQSITLQNGQTGYPPSLTALVGGVTDANSTTGAQLYFLRSIPRDPFYPDQTTPAISTWALRSYATAPDSPPDQNPLDVYDVHSMSTQTGLNGIPYANW